MDKSIKEILDYVSRFGYTSAENAKLNASLLAAYLK
jgi:hypothetical protein